MRLHLSLHGYSCLPTPCTYKVLLYHCPAFLGEASQVAWAAALAAETRKHISNDKRCQELGWVCVPIAVKTYGNLGQEAKQTFSKLASRLATDSSQPKSKVIADLYGRLNLTLMSAIARAILDRAFRPIRLFT